MGPGWMWRTTENYRSPRPISLATEPCCVQVARSLPTLQQELSHSMLLTQWRHHVTAKSCPVPVSLHCEPEVTCPLNSHPPSAEVANVHHHGQLVSSISFLPASLPWLQDHPAVLPPWETKLTWTDAVPTWEQGKFCPGQEQLGVGAPPGSVKMRQRCLLCPELRSAPAAHGCSDCCLSHSLSTCTHASVHNTPTAKSLENQRNWK